MYENYDLKSFENIKLLGERPNNWRASLLGKLFWIMLIIIAENIAVDLHNFSNL